MKGAATALAPAPAGARRAAFFDVDETLLGVKSLVGFWALWERTPEGSQRADQFRALLHRMRDGLPRAEANRAYYRLFAGVPLARFEEVSDEWYAGARSGARAAVPATMSALRRHQGRGDAVVLVSGSARALLAGPARDFGADLVLCARQTVVGGVLTGEVDAPLIGQAKALAVRRVLAAWGMDPTGCHAYGDHTSDLPMLRSVGHPAVVARDPELARRARDEGWDVLPYAPGPLPRAGGPHH
ncbi:HAD-IB family hydrolase [Streptomyces sp. NPDC047028]|uniref:HAD family hydrolase n=1 Tax=Streptomyces sp. NPDC047028 TaxID=3155793 RepID=UPI0033C52083